MIENTQQHPNPDIPSFSERYGLHPLVAAGAIALDTMLFGTLEVPSFGLLAVISFFFGLAAVVPFSLIQKHSYGDGWGAAWGKGTMLGLLVACPSPLPSALTVGWAALGFVGLQAKRARLANGAQPSGNHDDPSQSN